MPKLTCDHGFDLYTESSISDFVAVGGIVFHNIILYYMCKIYDKRRGIVRYGYCPWILKFNKP